VLVGSELADAPCFFVVGDATVDGVDVGYPPNPCMINKPISVGFRLGPADAVDIKEVTAAGVLAAAAVSGVGETEGSTDDVPSTIRAVVAAAGSTERDTTCPPETVTGGPPGANVWSSTMYVPEEPGVIGTPLTVNTEPGAVAWGDAGMGSMLVTSPTNSADAPGAIAMGVPETVIVGPPGRRVCDPMI
jgi:hypothetical protein